MQPHPGYLTVPSWPSSLLSFESFGLSAGHAPELGTVLSIRWVNSQFSPSGLPQCFGSATLPIRLSLDLVVAPQQAPPPTQAFLHPSPCGPWFSNRQCSQTICGYLCLGGPTVIERKRQPDTAGEVRQGSVSMMPMTNCHWVRVLIGFLPTTLGCHLLLPSLPGRTPLLGPSTNPDLHRSTKGKVRAPEALSAHTERSPSSREGSWARVKLWVLLESRPPPVSPRTLRVSLGSPPTT
jgi:hypothetical protein